MSQARAAEPALGPGFVGAVDIPGDHQVDPRQLCGAILEILGDQVVPTRAGEVLFNKDHRAIGLGGADGRKYYADHVVLAAGVGTGAITGIPHALTDLLRPVRGEVLRLRVPEPLQPLVTRTIRGVVQGRAVYIVPRTDGTIVLGATTREDDMIGVRAEGVHQLLRDAHRLVPGILDCEIYEMTAKARPGSPDDVPMMSRDVSFRPPMRSGSSGFGAALSSQFTMVCFASASSVIIRPVLPSQRRWFLVPGLSPTVSDVSRPRPRPLQSPAANH